eukprot:SAG11_NODE_2166_length_3726_cov_6.269369_2_plen_169_part_00
MRPYVIPRCGCSRALPLWNLTIQAEPFRPKTFFPSAERNFARVSFNSSKSPHTEKSPPPPRLSLVKGLGCFKREAVHTSQNYAAPPWGAAHGRMRFLGVSMRAYTTEKSHTTAEISRTAPRRCARPYVIPRCFDAHVYHREITYGRGYMLHRPETLRTAVCDSSVSRR